MNSARSRSHGRGVASHGPGTIRPGLCGFPRTPLLGNRVNRDKLPLEVRFVLLVFKEFDENLLVAIDSFVN